MHEYLLFAFASIPFLGIASVWLAWRLGLPSILVLLTVGIIVGPWLGLLHPDELFGDLIFPFVSLSVAIIMFEGGLSLNIKELREHGVVVRNLCTIGNLCTWVVVALSAHYILDLNWVIAILLGSILVVTGPTVILPLLAHIHPNKQLSSILRWEGIMIDPVGAIQAIFVLEIILLSAYTQALGIGVLVLARTLIFGGVLGLVSALILIGIIRKRWAPDYLQELLTLMILIGVFALSNHIQQESGLFAVTIMGIILANQKFVTVKHIVTFKENLTLLLLSTLFITLAARLPVEELLALLHLPSLIFLLVIIFVARPLAVFVSTRHSNLTRNEKLFLCWMAPRGIVAAAVASLFAISLENAGIEQASSLVSITFLVIISTVILYGLTAKPVGHLLGVLQPKSMGVMIVGAHGWARQIARCLKDLQIPVLMVDTNRGNIASAHDDGLTCIHGSVLSTNVIEESEVEGIGTMLALTPSDEVNLLSTIEYASVLGSQAVYRLYPEAEEKSEKTRQSLFLFGEGMSFTYISARVSAGAKFYTVKLTKSFTINKFEKKYPKSVILFAIPEEKPIRIFSNEKSPSTQVGDTLLFLA